MYQLYGIPNCNTVKKAKMWLEDNGIEFKFFNFKKETPTLKMLTRWEKFFGDIPANKKGPTFRKIKEEFESESKVGQRNLLLKNLSAIKRPILEKSEETLYIGFKEEDYRNLF